MTTMNQSSPKRDDELAMFTPPRRTWLHVFATKYGIFSASLAASAALIAFAAWVLFFHTPNRELEPALMSAMSVDSDAARSARSTAGDSTALFAPAETQSELNISPPTLEPPVAAAPDETVSSVPAPTAADELFRPAPSAADGSIASNEPPLLGPNVTPSSAMRSNKTKEKLAASHPRPRIDRETNNAAAQRTRPKQEIALALPTDKSRPSLDADASRASAQRSDTPPTESGPATLAKNMQTVADINSVPGEFASTSIAASPFESQEATTAAQKSGLSIIVNKKNLKPLSRFDISNIYRDRITRWPSGERILVLNLPLESGERHRFSTAVLEMSPMDAVTELSNRTITNRLQNIYRTKTAQAIISYVERDASAIGYVPAGEISERDNVRIVFHIP